MSGDRGTSGRSQRFIAGDSMRGIGVACVFLVHAMLAVSLPRGDFALDLFGPAGHALNAMGDAAIIMFFGLSGYLISRPFLKSLVLAQPLRAPQYLRRRIARIVPAYYVLLLATLLVVGRDGAPVSDLLTLATLSQAWSTTQYELHLMQGWTLSVELAFYLVLPLCVAGLTALARPLHRHGPTARAALVLTGLAVVTVAGFLMLWRADGIQASQNPLAWAWAFTPGIALATLEPLGIRHRTPAWAPGAVLVVALAALVGAAMVDRASEAHAPVQLLAGAAFLVSALLLHWQGRRPWRVADSRAATWLGERSYGLYLWHSLVLGQLITVTDELAPAAAFAVLVSAGFTISALCAELSWRYVERPAIAWSHGARIWRPVPSTRPRTAAATP